MKRGNSNTVIADKGFAGAEFEQLMAELHALFLRSDRKNEQPRYCGKLGRVRQTIESIIDTLKGQLSLEQHGAHTMNGVGSARRSLFWRMAIDHRSMLDRSNDHAAALDRVENSVVADAG